MTAELVIVVLAGLLGIVVSWVVFLRGRSDDTDPTTPIAKPVADIAVLAIDQRHDEAVSRIEAVEDSDTPATDAADLAAERLRREREAQEE